MKASDHKLGMHRGITRRDFIHEVGLASAALGLPATAWPAGTAEYGLPVYYPPTRIGMRGSHPGSFEVAHALAREGKHLDAPAAWEEGYDLVVVGAGLSGLSAAYFYRKLHGPDTRILLLDNHDDFGGHAKRNEFHQGGPMRLVWGGTVNMEYPKYSEVAMGLITELGVDIPRLKAGNDFGWLWNGTGLQPCTWFGADRWGRDALIRGTALTELAPDELAAHVDQIPIPQTSREALRAFLVSDADVLADMSDKQKAHYLKTTRYQDFLRQHFQLPDDAIAVIAGQAAGYWGVRGEDLSVNECLASGLPGSHVLGAFGQRGVQDEATSQDSVMFPDGNASLARLLIRALMPDAFPAMPVDADPFGIVTQVLQYDRLDREGQPVRLRLNSTAVRAENTGDGVAVSYVKDGEVHGVRAKAAVLACYNRIIPHLCPQLPASQKAALAQCIKRPMLIVNVLLRNGRALRESGISGGYLPGRMCQTMNLVTGVNVPGYHPEWLPEDPCVIQFYGAVYAPEPDGLSISQQNQMGRMRLLQMPFEDFEREVRTVMNGVWGDSGFNSADDILAIMVDRWPHGYARDHLDLEDERWNADPPPNVVGRQPFGRIAIANSDAGADAFTHTAIDQAWRAVNELSDGQGT